MSRTVLGTATTGSDGRCVLPYTGTGKGQVKVLAECTVEGRTIQSEIYEVTDGKYYDEFSSDTSNRYYVYTPQGNSVTVSDGKLFFTCGTGSRYVRLQTSRTESTLDLSDFIGKTVKFKANIETSVNTVCSIICQTPSGDVPTSGNTINSDGLLEVEASIPSNATNVIFNINTGTTDAIINILGWLIYFV